MSYSAIRAALKARIQAALPQANVHHFQPYTREPPVSEPFRDLFADLTSDPYPAPFLINTVIFTRINRKPTQQLDGNRVSVVHHFQVVFLYAHKEVAGTNDTFQDMFEGLCRDLETGDRTLGGVAHTHGLPDGQAIGESEFYGEFVHDGRFLLQVEEVL